MTSALLTLQVPDLAQNRGVIIAASADEGLLLAFRRHMLRRAETMVEEADDEMIRQLRMLDLERLRRSLDAVIPEI